MKTSDEYDRTAMFGMACTLFFFYILFTIPFWFLGKLFIGLEKKGKEA